MPGPIGWSDALAPLCEGLARLLAPHGEVVLHDVASDTIVAIWNPFSGRKPGDPALLGDLSSGVGAGDVMGPFEKVTADGRRVTSISAVYCNEDGNPVGLLCVNLDRSPIDEVIESLRVLATPQVTERPVVLFDKDWREQIALAVEAWCSDRMVSRQRLARSQRMEIVAALDAADLFATRHAARHVAVALGISRATVYSMLREVRARGTGITD